MTEDESKALPLGTLVRKIGRKTLYKKTALGFDSGCCVFSRRGRKYNDHKDYEWLYGSEIEVVQEPSK